MDEAVLREKGLEPMNRRLASAENFCLLIGRRATLAPCANGVVHCVVFALTHSEVDKLYSEDSVSVYRPEALTIRLGDGTVAPALCFNLPSPPATEERNGDYALQLRALAERIGLPPDYVAAI